jgi:phosphatidylinositol alpha-mannosyltransferase
MRVALVSPYSWTYPGGVTRHIEALATELLAQGHHVRVLAPVDRDTPLTARLHARRAPAERPLPEWLVPLGRTVGLPVNGALSNLALSPASVGALRTELARGRYDVVHVHAPEAPTPGWDAPLSARSALVGTFHSYNPNALTHLVVADALGARRRFNRFHVRIAVSEVAEWQMRRWYGGRYRVIPNGVHVPEHVAAKAPGGRLEVVFVGQAVERKGLPVLLRAFEALRDHVPARLTVVGATPEEVAPLLLEEDRGDVVVLGKVDDAEKGRAIERADVLCAPSHGGESFGMVLTEAFAHGTPVVASDIPGYRDVVRHGVDGLLVPRGDAAALAGALRDLALDPARRARLGVAARERAGRFAVAARGEEVVGAYEDALAMPAPATTAQRVAVRHGLVPADGRPAVRPQKSPSPEAAVPGAVPARRRGPALRVVRRTAWGSPSPAASPCPSWPCSASASTPSRVRCSRRARRGSSSRWPSCARRWCSAPRRGARSCVPPCPRCACAARTRCRGR